MRNLLFAANVVSEPLPALGPMTPEFKEGMIVLGALLVILILVLGWAVMFRRHRQRSARREERRRRRQSFAKNAAKNVAEIREYVKERRRRRRREHRPRNPTLAETGGLPPIRDPRHPPSANPPA